ncbi:threonine--tRNA ligase [Candidatus Mycoplasma haematohominis]|uniref:Threonine--tRNA ligase n=1 Tax=Candidatus Mycoplasma haematohominis TaxID=1494318 RepID=A0A478FS78_9MOLU|nr:threonine--tRNA ligase [Candidatus Mycoplasma haemohominis]
MSKEKNQEGCSCCCVNNEDHRKFGEKLDIFDFDPLIGSGIPFWLENGFTLKETIKQYVNSIQLKNGITMVSTPELGRKELYETSGHWDHYRENIFPPIQLDESDDYVLRPMTCPHHILLYKRTRWHEKHLPIAYGENSRLYRYECSGGLFGLERTRAMELIDTHMFCSPEKLITSLQQALNIILEVKEAFQIQYHSIVLSLRDKNKDKFFDDDELWEKAEHTLRDFLDKNKIQYEEGIGDAAFYGPKIDFQIKTYSGKIITISTIQLDFLLPQKFNLQYFKGEQGEKATPIMIHLGIIGTLERFIAYLLERDQGWLPFWISPIQIAVIPVNINKHLTISQNFASFLQKLNIRVSVEASDESLGRRLAQTIEKRVYGHIILGDKEAETIQELISINSDIQNKSQNNWENVMKLISKNRGERENLVKEKYPLNHSEFLRWASLFTKQN